MRDVVHGCATGPVESPRPGHHRLVTSNTELGGTGEVVAVRYLERQAYRIIDRNWRCRQGEIDIVALDGRTLVVVEVKTRSSLAFGDPLEGVTDAKLARLCRLAGAWRSAHPAMRGRPTRIDLVGIVLPRRGTTAIDHLVGVA